MPLSEEMTTIPDMTNQSPSDLFCLADLKGEVIQVGQSWKQILFWNEKEVVGKHILDFIHPDDRERVGTKVQKLVLEGESFSNFEARCLAKKGHHRWFLWNIVISPEQEVMIVVAQDITDILQRDSFAIDLQMIAQVGYWRLDHSNQKVLWTEGAYHIHEVTDKTNLTLESFLQFFVPDARPTMKTLIDRCSETKEVFDVELPAITSKGRRIWVRVTGRPQIVDGAIVGIYGIIQDISENRNTQERLKLALQTARMGTWDWNVRTGYLHWDESLLKLYDLRALEFRNDIKSWEKWIYPDDLSKVRSAIDETLRQGHDLRLEFRIVKKDGSVGYIRSSGYVEYDQNEEPVRIVGIDYDITEQVTQAHDLEIQRSRAVNSSKMAALGEMAAGIAHEINNPLTVIVGKAYQMKQMISKSDFGVEKLLDHIARVEQVTHRISKIVKGLKAFSRSSEQEPMSEASISVLLDETLEMCRERYRDKEIELRMRVSPDVKIDVRPTQISQVILNILNNSYDAILELPEKWVEIEVQQFDDRVCIMITDSGRGIPPAIASKIMQPFFTTKDIGKGTGLGLSISKGILEGHGGTLSLDQMYRHTRFVIELPRKRMGSAA